MPNYCYNKLTVRGPTKEQERFKAAVATKDQVISFNTLVPLPTELAADSVVYSKNTNIKAALDASKTKKYGAKDWYEWRLAYWGTKWDVLDDELCEGGGKLVYIFNTAWSPPDAWLYAVSNQFPKLSFTLYCREDGMSFKGTLKIKGGTILRDTIK